MIGPATRARNWPRRFESSARARPGPEARLDKHQAGARLGGWWRRGARGSFFGPGSCCRTGGDCSPPFWLEKRGVSQRSASIGWGQWVTLLMPKTRGLNLMAPARRALRPFLDSAGFDVLMRSRAGISGSALRISRGYHWAGAERAALHFL